MGNVGTHEELLNKCDKYKELIKRQNMTASPSALNLNELLIPNSSEPVIDDITDDDNDDDSKEKDAVIKDDKEQNDDAKNNSARLFNELDSIREHVDAISVI